MKTLIAWPILFYLRFLAKLAIRINKPTIIGIAGSVGKTSARNAIYAVLQDHFNLKMVGNSETGIPLGILGIVPSDFSALGWFKNLVKASFGLFYLKNTKYLIAEMGIDDPYPPKNMAFLLSIVKPDIAIELNVSVNDTLPAHAMQFEKLLENKQIFDKHEFLIEKIAEEDTKIITKSNCSTAIYNTDDISVKKIITAFEQSHPQTNLLTFGKNSENNVSYGPYKISEEGTQFGFLVNNPPAGGKKVVLSFAGILLPKEYQEVIAAAILVGLQSGLSLHQITSSLEKNFAVPYGRASMFSGINNSLIIDSSYNASRASVVAFLDMVKLLKKQTKREVVFLFGDMRELGSESQMEHQEVAKYMLGIVNYVYLVGGQTKEFVLPILESQVISNKQQGIKKLKWFDNAREAGLYLKNHLPKNSIVLVKGSQNTIFLEEAIKFILKNKEDESNLCRQDEHFLKVKLRQYGS